MKAEKLFDVLMYLFENYTNNEELVYTNPKLISREMIDAGFHPEEIDKVLYWFNDLIILSDLFYEKSKKYPKSIRSYSREECKKLGVEARNYLFYLERVGIIDVGVREFVIDQAMSLDVKSITVKDIKWLVFVVIFKGPCRSKMKKQLLATLIVDEDKKVKN